MRPRNEAHTGWIPRIYPLVDTRVYDVGTVERDKDGIAPSCAQGLGVVGGFGFLVGLGLFALFFVSLLETSKGFFVVVS